MATIIDFLQIKQDQEDQEIKKSWEEFDNFREEQNNEMLKEMNGK